MRRFAASVLDKTLRSYGGGSWRSPARDLQKGRDLSTGSHGVNRGSLSTTGGGGEAVGQAPRRAEAFYEFFEEFKPGPSSGKTGDEASYTAPVAGRSDASAPAYKSPRIEDKGILEKLVNEERELWMKADREGRQRDLFHKWSHMDGYDRAAKALLSLPFPEGHFQRIELFQSNLFGPVGIEFKRPLLLSLALMHQSWINNSYNYVHYHHGAAAAALIPESSALHQGNAGLELMGDAVLRHTLCVYLLGKHKGMKNKLMVHAKAKMENNDILGILALTEWGISTVMLCKEARIVAALKATRILGGNTWKPGMGSTSPDDTQTDKATVNFSANCVEAILAALTISHGADVATMFVENRLAPSVERTSQESEILALSRGNIFDPCSKLGNMVQQRFKQPPSYQELSSRDRTQSPVHQFFCVAVVVLGETLAVGEGSSMKEARRNAALRGIQAFHEIHGGGQ